MMNVSLHRILPVAAALLLSACPIEAQDWHLVKAFPQKCFPKTVPAGNYSGLTHLEDDVYAVVSDKSDSALYFRFRIQVDPHTGELESVANLGFTEYVDGSKKGDGAWRPTYHGLDHEAIAKVSPQTLVVTSEGKDYDLKEFPIMEQDTTLVSNLWTYTFPADEFYPNYQLESLAFDANRQWLWSISESTLRKDGKPSTPQNGLSNKLRLFAFDWQTKSIVASYAYQMDAPSTGKQAETYVMGVSELCVLPDGQLLVLEREAFIPKMKLGAFCKCKLYVVNPSKEQVFGMDRPFDEHSPFVEKRLLMEWKTDLTLFGRSFANYEGMCLGPQLDNGDQVVILLSDSQDQYAGVLKDWFKTIVISQ